MQTENPTVDELIEFDTVIPDFSIDALALPTDEPVADDPNEDDDEVQDTPVETVTEDTHEEPVNVSQEEAGYRLLSALGLFDLPEEFKYEEGTLQNFPQQYQQQLLNNAIENSNPLFKDALIYAYSKPDLTKEDLVNFIGLQQSVSELPTIENVEQAKAYLKQELSNTKVFKNRPDKLNLHLEAYEDDEAIQDAQNLVEEKRQQREADKAQQIKEAKEAKLQRETAQKEWAENLSKEILTYNKPIQSDLQRVAKEAQEYTKSISSSPKAYVQFLNMLRHYDKEKGEFDFSKIEIKNSSDRIKVLKENIKSDALSSTLQMIAAKGKPAKSRKDVDSLEFID